MNKKEFIELEKMSIIASAPFTTQSQK